MYFKTIIFILILTLANESQSTSLLFDYQSGGTNPSPTPYVISSHIINLDFDAIKAFPDSIQINFPDSTSTIVNKQFFDPRGGYIERDEDEDPPGIPEFWIDPNATREDFSFMWSGSNDDFDIVITAYKGLLSATISGFSGRYVINKQGTNYQFTHVNLVNYPTHLDDTVTTTQTSTENKQHVIKEDNTYITHLKSFDYSDQDALNNRDANNPNVVDILVVYNEAARIESGGSPADPNDNIQIEQNIIAEIDNLNIALSNSNNSTRVTRFHVAKINGLTHTTDRETTLEEFRLLNSVKALRNQVGADVVSGIIDTDFTNFTACGLAYGHTSVLPNGPWTIGTGFNEYAYNITSYFCILFDFTFTHEFGHLLGTQHARDEPFTPVDVVTANGYPYAFGWRDGDFKSVMSTTQLTTSRRLNFSNPNVSVDGIPTGVNNSEHNQRVIDELTVFATNYRQRADLIFLGDFE